MKDRCSNPANSEYHNYGGRRIKVYDAWATSFTAFLNDVGEAPKGCSLDRIDVNGDYRPDNCRWATPQQQSRNKRNNTLITFNGQTRCVAEWAEISGLTRSALHYALNMGVS